MELNPRIIESRLKHFKEIMKQNNLKLTPQRLEIFRIAAESQEHPSAEVIHSVIRERMPMVSLDTVYRTLWMLNDLGVITTLGTRKDSVRFDANICKHHHYICVKCGLARDFESKEFDDLTVPTPVTEFGSITSTQIEVRGICRTCQHKMETE